MMKKIGIFAGTFDPIHEGHLAFARMALEHGIEKVMFLPEPRPRRKQGVRALEHRVAMVRLAIEHEPHFGMIILEQARFTMYETLPVLHARFPGHTLVLLFGDDVVDHIASWTNIEALVYDVELLIASRHKEVEDLKTKLNMLQQVTNIKFNWQIVYPARENISSSVIRRELKRHQKVTSVPAVVQNYLKKNKLYTEH